MQMSESGIFRVAGVQKRCCNTVPRYRGKLEFQSFWLHLQRKILIFLQGTCMLHVSWKLAEHVQHPTMCSVTFEQSTSVETGGGWGARRTLQWKTCLQLQPCAVLSTQTTLPHPDIWAPSTLVGAVKGVWVQHCHCLDGAGFLAMCWEILAVKVLPTIPPQSWCHDDAHHGHPHTVPIIHFPFLLPHMSFLLPKRQVIQPHFLLRSGNMHPLLLLSCFVFILSLS